MLQMKEFIYSIVRHWRRFVLLTLLMLVLSTGFYMLRLHTREPNEASELISRTEWKTAEKFYVGKLKYVGIGSANVGNEVVRDAYMANLYGTDFKVYIQENCFEENEILEYISKIISISNGGLNNGLVIECIYYDIHACADIMDAVKAYICNLHEDMAVGLGMHQLFLVDSSVNEIYEDASKQWVETVKNYILQEDPQANAVIEDFTNKEIVVYSILIILAVNFLAAIWILFSDSMHDRVYNVQQISVEGLQLLGDFSYKNLRGRIDRFLYGKLLSRIDFSDPGMAKTVNFKLLNTRDKKSDVYLLMGKIDEKKLCALTQLLNEQSGGKLRFSYQMPLNEDADGIENWDTNIPFIYVARRFEENKQEIQDILQMYGDLGISFAGLLFV